MAQGSYMETPYYNNNDTAMAQGSYLETPYYNNNDTAMAQGSYLETPYYNNNDTAMAQGSYLETPYYNNNDTAMAQGSYMETPYYNNNDTAMAQGSYMETPYYNNNDTAMAQGSYLETPYYNNNDTAMAQGSYLETPYYNNNDTAMAQGSYLETPYCSNNTSTTMVPTAQDYHMYMGTTYYNNNTSTTVVPLTQEWVSRLQTNMNDGYGPSMIMEKFLTSLPECEREAQACQDGSVQECSPEVGENEISSASESCNKSKQMTRSEMTKPEVVPPGDIGQDCSNDGVKSPPCLTPDNNHTGDVEGPIGVQDADLLNHLDDWIILLSCEPGLVDKLSDYTTEKIQLLDHFELDHQSVCGLEDLEDIQFLDQIELDHQSLGTEDLEEIQEVDRWSVSGSEDPEEVQLLDFSELDHQSEDAEEKFQLLDPIEMPGLCVWQSSVPEVVTTNRLSRYDLYKGPTHRVRSPSCPLIGGRGDSRERSVYSEDTAVAVQDHRVNDIAVRTAEGKTVKAVAHKAHCYRSPTAPMVNPPIPGCPCWLLLMGLASVLVATIDVKQKLGKLLGKSCQGQPHYRQPHTQQKTSYVSKYPRWKTCLLCLRLPWQLTIVVSCHSD
ncbi:Hypp3696 [Branchiostoma lanceolatum]|uniref:Hypp3696 protein n=1 Tax=Branchiostoma lanceolatum TaxID=7740 RepID=A0A8K0A3I9_BRALA|nr:Hypp3696 [Branchiostoma lanceolatum]